MSDEGRQFRFTDECHAALAINRKASFRESPQGVWAQIHDFFPPGNAKKVVAAEITTCGELRFTKLHARTVEVR